MNKPTRIALYIERENDSCSGVCPFLIEDISEIRGPYFACNLFDETIAPTCTGGLQPCHQCNSFYKAIKVFQHVEERERLRKVHKLRCEGCGNIIEPTVCHCGEPEKDHHAGTGHNFMAMGCTCGYVKKDEGML